MPSKLTPQLVGQKSPAKIKTLLETEIKAALEELVVIAAGREEGDHAE